jgi:drug/metabolite transporter (DMT)-like permease
MHASFDPRALLWLLGAISTFATMDAAAKWLGQTYPLLAGVWIRYLIPTVLLGGYLIAKKGRHFAHAAQPKIQIARGITLVTSTAFFWLALANLPLVEAAVVSFVCPTIVVLLSSLLLNERPARAHWIALVLGFVGVLIALRPGLTHTGIGAFAALASATFYATYIVLTRKVAGEVDALPLLFHANAVGALLLTVASPAFFRVPQGMEWPLLLGIGTFGLFGHWCMIRAYALATATALAPFMYVQLAFSTFWGWLVFNRLPDGFTLVGVAFILTGGFVALRYERGRAATVASATPE